MHTARQFRRFLVAWSLVSLIDSALNCYAGELPSLAGRSVALGALLLLASASYCLDASAPTAPDCMDRKRAAAVVYAALIAALGLPGTIWRYLAPLDTAGLAALHHGAGITFIFGVLTLYCLRVLGGKYPVLSAGTAS